MSIWTHLFNSKYFNKSLRHKTKLSIYNKATGNKFKIKVNTTLNNREQL